MKILLTSTSFQDTPGKHQELLNQQGFEIDTMRGPLKKEALLPVIGNYDGIICGDDEITEEVIKNGVNGKLKVISKYGIGLDKIDLSAAEKYKIPVTNCPGVNHVTVAEHVFALILAFYKNIHLEYNITKQGKWQRLIGHELYGKILGIIGLGRIGKELAKRAIAFGVSVHAFDKNSDKKFVSENNIIVADSIQELVSRVDILSLNTNLNPETKGVISLDLMKKHIKKGMLLVNTARGELVDINAVLYALDNKILSGYVTDVLDEEPMPSDHPLSKRENVIITPHIGSRTYESVERQGTMAVENLLKHLLVK